MEAPDLNRLDARRDPDQRVLRRRFATVTTRFTCRLGPRYRPTPEWQRLRLQVSRILGMESTGRSWRVR
jgi:hypothetical protein